MRKIDPSEYMVDGWDRQGTPNYVRGSRHNKIGMTIMSVSYTHLRAHETREDLV